MSTLTLPTRAELDPAASSPRLRALFALISCVPCMAMVCLSPDVAWSLVQAAGPFSAYLIVLALMAGSAVTGPMIAFAIFPVDSKWVIVAGLLVVGGGIALGYGVRLPGMDSGLDHPGISGWRYLAAVNNVQRARYQVTSSGANPAHPLVAAHLPNPTTTPPAMMLAASHLLDEHPPLLGEQATRFAMAGRITRLLSPSQARQLEDAGLVPSSIVLQFVGRARAHPPSPSANVLTQQAWLRLAGEQPWYKAMTAESVDDH